MLGRSSLLAAFAVSAFTLFACGSDTSSDDAAAQTGDSDLLKSTGPTSNWSYRGLMPPLAVAEAIVSLRGHTVRITGLLRPEDEGRIELPFYARSYPENGRTRVHIAYPMATANPNSPLEDGTPARNPEPFVYRTCGGDNFHPTNEIGAFGGFPFVEYVCSHHNRDGSWSGGIAFHGPITSRNADGATYWSLLRGPVSHGCNRMLGEHVLELAHLIGFDTGALGTHVTVVDDFDYLDGKIVDVDYPSYGWSRPAPQDATIFPIWQAVKLDANGHTKLDFPQWACETSRCASMPPNARDPYTGAPL
jgi:hypothetical protein